MMFKSYIGVLIGAIYGLLFRALGGLLEESIELVEYPNYVHFKIMMDMSQLRNVPMDRHILESAFFEFTNISYHLKETAVNETELTLKCSYKIESKMNFYANFWAERVVRDFEERLLTVLKMKMEKTNTNMQTKKSGFE